MYCALSLLQANMDQVYTGSLVVVNLLWTFLKMFYCIGEAIYKLLVPMKEKDVKGEIVLVTGAGHGIGKELALKYASLGATVVCWDLNQEFNEETVTEIKKIGGTFAYGYTCDVSKREEVLKVAEKVKEEVGNVTILINNAGIMPCHSFLDHTPEEIRNIFDVNVLAHFWVLQAFLPSMIEKNHGHIVALSSMAGMIGLSNLVPYCASKFAVRGFMEALSEELREYSKGRISNINFTTIYPYIVDTGLCKKPRIKFKNFMAMLSPKEAANIIVRAQRMNWSNISIPRYLLGMNTIFRVFPEKSSNHVKDFFDTGIEAT
ncbi:PREDICTED: short-chain dehydrogenase/reductase family 16C member 6-like isoform X1 [Polistes canadensis]|uniref:short-chain dehydrogenase/reductase family 16C member 6-like isoform X1 n=2 Tax=Polistes canadensis TaxID=91411 RepID=UPI000718B952|nr:PREDICTED: short-chain dehydrogenase/reductase family 16C member 6-like isoform X1 [Polistes canadensis]